MRARPEHASDDYYGLGIDVQHVDDATVVSHAGSVGGFQTMFMGVPETGFGFVILLNGDWHFPHQLAQRLLRTYGGVDLTEDDFSGTFPENEAALDEYVGTYEDPAVLGTVTLTREGSNLRFDSAATEHDYLLRPLAPDVFWYQAFGTQLIAEFVRDEGQVRFVVTSFGVAER